MSTDNFAKSMQQKLATASDKEPVTPAQVLDSMTDELEESELEAVSGGVFGYSNPGRIWERYVVGKSVD